MANFAHKARLESGAIRIQAIGRTAAFQVAAGNGNDDGVGRHFV